MTTRAFLFQETIDPARLVDFVAESLGIDRDLAMVYENAFEIEGGSNGRGDGLLWRAFENSTVRIYLSQYQAETPRMPGWFAIETARRVDNDFDDRVVAAAVSRGLGLRIIFRDPVPHPQDSPFVEASMIAVDPDGTETELWVTEHADDDGEPVTEVLSRREAFS